MPDIAVRSYSVPNRSGLTDITLLFAGKKVVYDSFFKAVIEHTGPKSVDQVPEFVCRLYYTDATWNTDDAIVRKLFLSDLIDGHRIGSVLAYLSGDGFAILKIPKGKKSVSLIIGYASINADCLVLFVEHKSSPGAHMLHFRAQALNQWGDETPMVLLVG